MTPAPRACHVCHVAIPITEGCHAIAMPIITGDEQALYHHFPCGAAAGCEDCTLTQEN